MTAHDHTELVPGCYRCELNKDEEFEHKVSDVMSELQRNRICTATCEHCRTMAEAIVRKLSG